MSLVTSASPWSNEETPKKRIPSMRKTAKKLSPVSIYSIGLPDNYISIDTSDNLHPISFLFNNKMYKILVGEEDSAGTGYRLLFVQN